MIFFPDLGFLLNIPLYAIAIILSFFLPGNLITKRFGKQTVAVNLTLSLTIGICLWIVQGLIFGYLQTRYLSYVYMFITTCAWMRLHGRNLLNFKLRSSFQKIVKIDKVSLLIVLFGGFIQLSAVWLIGFRQQNGILFCCRSVPDSIYHIALTNELAQNFPPMEPGSWGIVVKNYHYLSNLAIADLIRVFHLPLIPTLYQYTSIFLIFFISLGAISFSLLLSLGKRFQRFLLFFLFFSGDAIFVLAFLRNPATPFEATGMIDDASKMLTALPRPFSIGLYLGLLSLVTLWTKNKNKLVGLFVAITTGLLMGTKVYTALFAMLGLGMLSFYYFIRKDFKQLWVFPVAILTALAVYLPVNSGSGGLVFVGTWRLENFVSNPNLDLMKLEFARLTFQQSNNWFRVTVIEIFYLCVYLFSVLGTINFGWLQTKTSLRKFPIEIHLFLATGILGALTLGLFFIQQTGGANTIQFIISILIIGSIYASLSIANIASKLWNHKIILSIVIFLILSLSSVRTIHEGLANFFKFSEREKFRISGEKLKTLQYLETLPKSSKYMLLDQEFAFQSSSMYLSSLTNQKLFVAGVSDHEVKGLKERVALNKEIFNDTNCTEINSSLENANIGILYLKGVKSLYCFDHLKKYKIIYQSKNEKILQY